MSMLTSDMVGRLAVVLVFVMGWQPLSCLGQGDQSLLDSLGSLEARAGLGSSPPSSLLERLAVLEQKVLGQAGSGSLFERMERLRRALGPDPRPATSGPPANLPGQRGAAAMPANPQPSGYKQGEARIEASGRPLLSLVDAEPPRFVRIEPPNPKQRISGDYYGEVMKETQGKVFRFKNMPIPVFITPYPDRDFTESCINGFEAWEQRTDGLVRFTQVDNPDQARIRVIWSKLGMSSDIKGCTLGAHTITKWKAKGPGTVSVLNVGVVPVPIYIPKLGPKYSVPPQVIEVNLDLVMSKSPEIRFQVLENVVAHELGHALGLLGHSPYQSDLMYPITDEHSRLSPRDINTIIKVYHQSVDIPL